MASENLYVLNNYEVLTPATLNAMLENSYNANSHGRTGCLLSLGSISINTASNLVTFNDLVISLPDITLTNTDTTSRVYKGIEMVVGSISKTIAVGSSTTIVANFNITESAPLTEKQFSVNTGAGTVNYEGLIRTNQAATIDYTDSEGDIGVTLFTFKNNGGGKYTITPSNTSAVLPMFCSIPYYAAYSTANLSDNTLVPYGIVKELIQQEFEKRNL